MSCLSIVHLYGIVLITVKSEFFSLLEERPYQFFYYLLDFKTANLHLVHLS